MLVLSDGRRSEDRAGTKCDYENRELESHERERSPPLEIEATEMDLRGIIS
jgi:hypothetical protein